MGTTFCSIHIYSSHPIASDKYRFHCFSPGWHTYLFEKDSDLNPDITRKTARHISNLVSAPVLWFYLFDDDILAFKFYVGGKECARYSSHLLEPNRNISKISELIGYTGHNRDLSHILNCSDLHQQIELLEDFFGVCLLPFPELVNRNPQSLHRERTSSHINNFITMDKRLSGKHGPIQVQLVQEVAGVLDCCDWFWEWFEKKPKTPVPHFSAHYYLFSTAHSTERVCMPVHFNNGKINIISSDEMKQKGANRPNPYTKIGDSPLYTHHFYPNKLYFTDTAPTAYRNREILLPRGFFGLGFDSRDRLVLFDDKSTFAIADEHGKIIAKQRLKGQIQDLRGDFILTVEDNGYNGVIRVYHFGDK